MHVHAIGPARWFHWVAAAALLAGATWLLWPRPARLPMPPLPVAPPTPVVREVPKRAVPCVDTRDVTLRMQDGAPVVCSEADCMRLDLEQMAATRVARPAAAPVRPLAATVQGIAAGKHLAAALAHASHAEATLDRSTVVADNAIWNVATDREVTLRPPEIRPDGPEHDVAVVGDLLLVKWQGSCTDSQCLVSQLVDRRGHEVGWVQAGGRVVRLDDAHVLTISEFSVMQVLDLHTGAVVSDFDPRSTESDFRDVVELDAESYALLREAGDGVIVSRLDLQGGSIMVINAQQMTLPTCPAL